MVGGGGGFESNGSVAGWNASHPLSKHLNALLSAPGTARISMAIGELASTIDYAAGDESISIGVSAIKVDHRLGMTALSLAALWAKWGRSTCLIDLGTGSKSLAGAMSSTKPDLGQAVNALSQSTLPGLARLHGNLNGSAAIAAGNVDVLGVLSTGGLANLVDALKKKYDRIVMAAPSIDSSFPFLGLNRCCDRLVLSMLRGKTRGGPVREIAEQAMTLGMRPLDVIWYD